VTGKRCPQKYATEQQPGRHDSHFVMSLANLDITEMFDSIMSFNSRFVEEALLR
jgi:hypothetical protein